MPFGDGYHDEDFEADCDRECAEEAAERREAKREERAQRADPATFAPAVLTIDLNLRDVECVICGADATGHNCGLPMYEGEVVPVDYEGEWGGFDCCRACLAAYEAGGPDAVHARRKRR